MIVSVLIGYAIVDAVATVAVVAAVIATLVRWLSLNPETEAGANC